MLQMKSRKVSAADKKGFAVSQSLADDIVDGHVFNEEQDCFMRSRASLLPANRTDLRPGHWVDV